MKSFHERFPEVPSSETVLLELYCSFNENGSKNRGRLYITPRRLAFYPMMGSSKKVILLENIQEVQKSKGFISTGIDLVLSQGAIVIFYFKTNIRSV